MKKALDKVWEWMKTTAWFQVVILVGVLVGIVLCISPITTGIQNAIANSKEPTYFAKHKINYDKTIEKIADVDEDGFAVLLTKANTCATYEQGIENYSNTQGSKEIFILNNDVCDDTKTSYNQDEKWFQYYKFDYNDALALKEVCSEVYKLWAEDSTRNSDYVIEQTADAFDTSSSSSATSPSGLFPTAVLIWFRAESKIDTEVKAAQADSKDASGKTFNFHIAKVYTNFVLSGSDNTDTNVLNGLTKFFSANSDSLNNEDNFAD